MKQQLAEWIAEPGKVSPADVAMLTDFVKTYPYFQPLHLLLAKATAANGADSYLPAAALYTNGQLLHNFIHAPGHLLQADFKIIDVAAQESGNNEPVAIDDIAIDEVSPESLENQQLDEQETYDEISELNINDYLRPFDPAVKDEEKPAEEKQPAGDALENNLVLENIVATDFFAFQDNFKVETVPVAEYPGIEEYIEPEPVEQEETVISKYDDDALPYTFLWWLAKTRKEHQQIFQPYASPKQNQPAQEVNPKPTNVTPELQQQYVEHIFHLQTPFNHLETDAQAVSAKLPTKGDEIIESFIKNEPQISPPNPEQINNENKARKSAEDRNDLVSETLAKIYIEQMLYDKAIETYEKLSLKFPEKSRYFADLIQSIERKI